MPPEHYHHPPHQPMLPYPPHPGPPTVLSSRDSITTTSSQRAAQLALNYGHASHLQTEKDKMLRGQLYLHWRDSQLIRDRQECTIALELYNNSAKPAANIDDEQRARFFSQILNPAKRPTAKTSDTAPKGSIGDHTIVESPFNCDYGYNILLGDDVVIQAGCYMQDACNISIGNRVIVGPSVKFYCITAALDCKSRKGSQGHVSAGAIKIEDDVFIGGDVIILPHVTVGKGAVIGAGSVVTRVSLYSAYHQ
jgi:acetyltransferase-like isoleucine patch superfamily enzyme